MTIGERIKARRKEIHMSADELGKILGKDRSTIFRYEKGEIENLPLDVLEPIADALDVTPAYLMGWEPEEQKINSYTAVYGELAVAIDLFDSLNEDGRQRAIDYMEMLKKIYKKEESHE